jgi:hypothetical protein
MPKAEATVDELVGMIERGELRLPEMQRRYVWRSTRVRDLMDSLYRGYPSGAILLWETTEAVPEQDMAVPQSANAFHSTRLLLDGQQRLTSLSAIIRGNPVKVRGRTRPVELLFNLDHPETLAEVTEVDEDDDRDDDDDEADQDMADASEDELEERFNRLTFVVATRKLENRPQWVNVTTVFKTEGDSAILKGAGVTNFDHPNYKKYSQRLERLRRIKKYVYRMDILERELSYDEVTEIFVRVNSLGAKLRSSDLALAQITAKWRNSLKVFESFQKECSGLGFDLELGLLTKNLVVFATGQSRFLRVANLSAETLKGGWRDGKAGIEFALNFLRSNARIDSPALLASPFLIITLAYYGHSRGYSLSKSEAEALRRWALLANAKGRYSRGSSETLLDQDIMAIRTGGDVKELVDRLRSQVGRLDIQPDELEGRNQRSAIFKTMFLAFRAAGAKDWKTQVEIALSHAGATHKLQFHHVFPKNVLRGSFTSRETDDIANLCFISGKTNRQISDTEPHVYIEPIIEQSGTAAFDAQCIPVRDGRLLEVPEYKAFLAKRRELITDRLNLFLSPS